VTPPRLSGLLRRRQAPPGDGPILAVDIDGVVSLFGFEGQPPGQGTRMELIDGTMHCILVSVGARLRRLSDHYEIVWATGLERGAESMSKALGLPRWPYLTFRNAARFGSADWKLGPLTRYARGRPLAWIDDSFDATCYEWARERKEPTLLVATQSDLGLQDVQVDALLGWARSLAAEADQSPAGG
jgi:hypothetical protein